MDLVVNGIVLKVIEYKDKDVLATIFTAQLGKITAVLKGVRGANAKLKYASQPFCFGEWQLAEKGGKFTVTSCSAENLFYELTNDYDRYTLACAMLEMCDIVLKPGMVAPELLVLLLGALKNMTYEDYDEKVVMLKFLLSYSKMIGYGFNWNTCGNCGCNLIGGICYSVVDKTFTCKSCAGFGAIDVSKAGYTNLKIIDETDMDRLGTISVKPEIVNNCLYILRTHIENILGCKLHAIDSWN